MCSQRPQALAGTTVHVINPVDGRNVWRERFVERVSFLAWNEKVKE